MAHGEGGGDERTFATTEVLPEGIGMDPVVKAEEVDSSSAGPMGNEGRSRMHTAQQQ